MPTLLQKIADGDRSAVEACVDEYGGLVWRLARRYLDRADAFVDDAVQDVFVELWMSAARFDPAKGSEAAFVATIAHRRLTDAQRRVTLQRRTDGRRAEQAPPPVQDVSPAESAGGDGDIDAMLRAFDALPGDERTALWLSLRAGLTHREISLATRSPVGTVKTRLRRGLTRLRSLVATPVAEGAGS